MSFILNPLTRWYAGKLGSRLGSLGLKYHDVVAETGVYMKAISRLPEDMQEARVRRIKRGMDLSSKHVGIPSEQQEDPFSEAAVVSKMLARTQFEHDESRALAKRYWMPYGLSREPWFPYDTKAAWFWRPAQPVRKLL